MVFLPLPVCVLSFQLSGSFPPPGCSAASCAVPYAVNMTASIRRNVWDRTNTATTVTRANGGVSNGGFLDACEHHCGYSPTAGDDVGLIQTSGMSPLQALAAWYDTVHGLVDGGRGGVASVGDGGGSGGGGGGAAAGAAGAAGGGEMHRAARIAAAQQQPRPDGNGNRGSNRTVWIQKEGQEPFPCTTCCRARGVE